MASDRESVLLRHWKLACEAARDRELSRTDVAVLTTVLDCINTDPGKPEFLTAWPGLGTIARGSSADRSSVARSVRRLVTAGYLQRESGGFKTSNIYRAGMGRCESAPSGKSAPSGESATGVGAKSHSGVGANPHPDLAYKNLPKELAYHSAAKGPDADDSQSRFAEFYSAYPRKVSKLAAEKAWSRAKLDPIANAIVADVRASAAPGGRWHDVEDRFIPHPATYLNGRKWEDEWRKPGPAIGRLPRDPRSDEELAEANEAALVRVESRIGAVA